MATQNKFVVGTDDYNGQKLQSALFNNIDVYAQKQHMNDKELQQFREAVGYTLQGMRDGTISSIDLNGNLVDSRGQGNAMMGQVVHYMRDLLSNDRTKKLNYQSEEKKKYSRDMESDVKDYLNAGKDIDDDFIDRWNKMDYRAKLQEAANLVQTRINKINSGELDMTDVDANTEIANLQAALNAIKDGKIDNNENPIFDKIGWSSAGVLLQNGTITKKPTWETDLRNSLKEEGYTKQEIEEEVAAERESRRWDREDAREERRTAHEDKLAERQAKKHEQNWQRYANQQYVGTYNKSWNLGKTSYKDTAAYENDIIKLGIDPEKYLKMWYYNPDGYTGKYSNKDWLKNYLAYLAQTHPDEQHFVDNGDGSYILPASINYNTGRALTYNPTNGTLKEINPTKGSKLLEILRSNWYNHNPLSSTSSSSGKLYKEGGIIKLADGGNVDYTVDDIKQALQSGQITEDQAKQALAQLQASQSTTPTSTGFTIAPVEHFSFLDGSSSPINVLSEAKKNSAARSLAALKGRAAAGGHSIEHQQYLEGNGAFEEADRIRLVNMLNDLSSIGTSYIPVFGTAIAGAQGLASMGLDFLADWKDKNVSHDQLMSNLYQNAGLAALGMLPGGAGKIGKVWKTFKKLLPLGIAAYGLESTLTDDNVKKSLHKLVNSGKANELNNQDWKNLMQVAKMVAFGHNIGKGTAQAYNNTLAKSKLPATGLLRKWGEASIGSSTDQAINTKMIRLGGLEGLTKEAAEVNDISGKSITVKTESGNKKLTLKPSAYKLLNDAIKNKKDAASALETVNETINNWMHNNPESYFRENTSGFKALTKESTKQKIEGLTLKGDIEGATLYENLAKLIEGKKDTDTVKLNFVKGDLTKTTDSAKVADIKAIQKEILKQSEIKEDDFTTLDEFKTKWDALATNKQKAAMDAANKLANETYVFEDEIPGAELPFTTTLGEADIIIPGKYTKHLPGKNNYVELEQVGTESLTDRLNGKVGEYAKKANPFIGDKYLGDSDAAVLNRNKVIAARAYEKMYNNPTLSSLFNNNWEMANGAGPFRFGAYGNTTNDEYNQAQKTANAEKVQAERIKTANEKYGQYSKDITDKIKEWSKNGTAAEGTPEYEQLNVKFESSPEGQKWLEEEAKLGRRFTEEEAKHFIDKVDFEKGMSTKLAKDIMPSGELTPAVKEYLNEHPDLKVLFEGASKEDLAKILTRYENDAEASNTKSFFTKVQNDVADAKTKNKSLAGLLERFKNEDTLEAELRALGNNRAAVEAELKTRYDGHVPDADLTEAKINDLNQRQADKWKTSTFENIFNGDERTKNAFQAQLDSTPFKDAFNNPSITDADKVNLLKDYKETYLSSTATNEEVIADLMHRRVPTRKTLREMIDLKKSANARTATVTSYFKDDHFPEATKVKEWYENHASADGTQWSELSGADKRTVLEGYLTTKGGMNAADASTYITAEFVKYKNGSTKFAGNLARSLGVTPTTLAEQNALPGQLTTLFESIGKKKDNLTNAEVLELKHLIASTGKPLSTIVSDIESLQKSYDAKMTRVPEEKVSKVMTKEALIKLYLEKGKSSALNQLDAQINTKGTPLTGLPSFAPSVKPLSFPGISPPYPPYFKSGGKVNAVNKLLSLKGGGNPKQVNNMNFSSTHGRGDWRSQIYSGYKSDIEGKINNLNDNDLAQYISWVNTMQDRHSKMYQKAGSDYTKKTTYDDEVLKYQNDYDNDTQAGYNTGKGKNAIEQAYNAGRYSAVGNTKRISGDSTPQRFKNDGYYGAITDDRRILGRVSKDGTDDWDQTSLSNMNTLLQKRGYYMFLDKNTNYYKIGKLPQSGTPTTYGDSGNLHSDNLDKLKEVGKNVLGTLWNSRDYLLALRRLRRDNNLARENAKDKLASLHPAYNPYYTGHSSVTDLTSSVQQSKNAAGKLNTTAGNLGTSNAETAAAAMLDAQRQGGEGITKTQMASDEYAQKRRDASDELERNIYNQNQGVLKSNIEIGAADSLARSNIRQAERKSIVDNKDNFDKMLEYDAKKNIADQKAARDQVASLAYQRTANGTNDPDYQAITQELEDLYYKSVDKELTDDEKKRYQELTRNKAKRAQELGIQAEDEYMDYFLNQRNNPFYSKTVLNRTTTPSYNYNGTSSTGTSSNYRYKTGGTIKDIREARIKARTEDDKEFNKNIQNSIKNSQAALNVMSKTTVAAIKKALGL